MLKPAVYQSLSVHRVRNVPVDVCLKLAEEKEPSQQAQCARSVCVRRQIHSQTIYIQLFHLKQGQIDRSEEFLRMLFSCLPLVHNGHLNCFLLPSYETPPDFSYAGHTPVDHQVKFKSLKDRRQVKASMTPDTTHLSLVVTIPQRRFCTHEISRDQT